MLAIELDVKGVIEKHPAGIREGRTEAKQPKPGPYTTATQHPRREAIGPNRW